MTKRSHIEDRLIAHLRETDDAPPCASEIAVALRISVDSVRRHLVLMERRGIVFIVGERPGRGTRTWRLATPPEGVG